MKKRIIFGLFLGLILGSTLTSGTVFASKSNQIDDSVFYNYSSMSEAQIANWINNNFPSSCLLPQNYPAEYNNSAWRNNTFKEPLPNNTFGGEVSPARIIWRASQLYSLNPQVVLTTLEKESDLVSGSKGCSAWRYNSAMGYNCWTGAEGYLKDYPDIGISQTCVQTKSYAGFSPQVDNATWQLAFDGHRANGDLSWGGWGNITYYGRMTQGYRARVNGGSQSYYDGYTTINGEAVYLENGPTAALYNYTPFFTRFESIFTSWFGSTTGPDYGWAIESFTYSGGDNIIVPGQTETLTLRARNTGRFPWYNHGDHPVRLGTWEPAGRISSLFNASKLTTVQESVVLPNQIGTFIFTVTPSTTGTFVEGLNLVAENSQWAQWPGFRPTIIVPKAYNWQIQNVIYSKGTGYMDPGETQLITLIAKNTGSLAWDKFGGVPVRVGTWQPQRQSAVGNGWLSATRAADMNQNTGDPAIQPGQTVGFQFYVRMPSSGPYYERLNLVAEGQAWFNDPGLTLYLYGNDYSWKVESVNYGNGTGVMAPGSTQTITVKARNTGTATWKNNGTFPVKLGTWQPQRQSQVSSAWSSPTRMSTLSESSVAPGAVGTFTATITMPSTGLFYEQMNLVAEGSQWFNNPGLTFYLQGKNP